MKPIQSITFAVNSSKPGAAAVAESLARLVEREGVTTRITQDYPLPADALIGQDLCCAIGGDGTLLGVLDAALESGSAVLGINLGKLIGNHLSDHLGDDNSVCICNFHHYQLGV